MRNLETTPATGRFVLAESTPGREAWEIAVAAFLQGKTLHTRRAYAAALRGFFDLIPGRLPGSVTVADVANYRAHLEAAGNKPSTVAARLAAVSAFYRFASRPMDAAGRSLCAANPVAACERPRVDAFARPRKTPRAAVETMLASLDGATDARSLRDVALLVTFTLTGRRRAEIAGLRGGDLETGDDGTVFYRYTGKRGKGGLRELPQPAAEAIGRYVAATGRESLAAEEAIFLSEGGRHRGAALQPDGIARILKGRARAAGVSVESVRVHGLRHLAAELRRAAGEPVEAVQSFLDHSSLSTTALYLRRVEGTKDAGWRGAWGLIRHEAKA